MFDCIYHGVEDRLVQYVPIGHVDGLIVLCYFIDELKLDAPRGNLQEEGSYHLPDRLFNLGGRFACGAHHHDVFAPELLPANYGADHEFKYLGRAPDAVIKFAQLPPLVKNFLRFQLLLSGSQFSHLRRVFLLLLMLLIGFRIDLVFKLRLEMLRKIRDAV